MKHLEAMLSLSLAACVGAGIMLLFMTYEFTNKSIKIETDRGDFLCLRMNKK